MSPVRLTTWPSSMPSRLAHHDDADLAHIKVQGNAESPVLEFEELIGHGRWQAFHSRNAVAGCDDRANLFAAGRLGRVVLDEAIQCIADFLGTNREFCHRLRFLLFISKYVFLIVI